jgi:cholesterol 7-dehydrogenase
VSPNLGQVSHDIICHIVEIAENGADVAHLEYLHGAFVIPGLSAIRHYWQCDYKPKPAPEQHIAKIDIYQSVTFGGYRLPYTTVHSDIQQIGPGLVQLVFPTPFGKIVVQESIQPQHSNLQRANNSVYAEPGVPRVLAKGLLKSLAIQFERDHPIWNTKKWLRKPLILKQDGPLLIYRRWVKQFYTEAGGKLLRNIHGEETWGEQHNNQHSNMNPINNHALAAAE